MRRMLLSLAILAGANSLRAGVYHLDPPSSKYPSGFVEAQRRNSSWVRLHWGQLRLIGDPQADPKKTDLLPAYLRQTAELEARQRAGTLSAADRINLGACLIRLGRRDRARAVLEEAERAIYADSPYRFLVLLNLAGAYQENAELLPRAIDTQIRALKCWPRVWAGWSSAESNWYRRAETYALRLMRLRHAEQRAAGGRGGLSYQTVDELFPGVRFLDSQGSYEAGAIAFEQWNKLPPDAESLVIQLMLWQPRDNRLYWLYGELLNARGQVADAFAVLDALDDPRFGSPRQLHAHRRILQEVQESFRAAQILWQYPNVQALLWIAAPRGAIVPPGIGYVAQEMGGAAAFNAPDPADPVPPSAAPSPDAPAPASTAALPDWRSLLVSFVAGMVVAVLAVLQWRQWRKA